MNAFNLDVEGLRMEGARLVGDGLEVDGAKLEIAGLDVEGAILEFKCICPDGEIGFENDDLRSLGWSNLFEVQFG